MAGTSFKIENLDALGRARDRVAALGAGGSKVIARAAATLKRRLVPWMKRDIGAQYALPSRKVGARLRCKADESSVTLTAQGRAQTLTNFPHRQTRVGVHVEIERGKPLAIAHAFVRTPTGSASGAGEQVFIRAAALGALPDGVLDIATITHDKHGYPIILLGGPTVAEMMGNGDRIDRAVDYGRELFAQEVDRLAEV